MRWLLITILMVLFVSGCASRTDVSQEVSTQPAKAPTASSRYSMLKDAAPVNPPDVSKVPDAVPRYEPHSRGGNRSPYKVFGQTYTVLPTAQGYKETGIASWYGEKFHGHLTSNGEVYDMFEMTAAHKSLPLPTFARVTNLDNGKSVVVRINDRGPFHEDRVIDLSYAAAHRLDILQQGTGRVKVEAITPPAPASHIAQQNAAAQSSLKMRASHDRRYLQVGAFSSHEAAQRAQVQLQTIVTEFPVGIYSNTPAGSAMYRYRVKIGPLVVGEPLDGLLASLSNAGFDRPHLVDNK